MYNNPLDHLPNILPLEIYAIIIGINPCISDILNLTFRHNMTYILKVLRQSSNFAETLSIKMDVSV